MSLERAKRPSALVQLLERLPSLTIVVGKGGVGKTTCAIGIAAHLAARGDATLLVATDPAESLASALGIRLADGEREPVDQSPGLSAMQLDPTAARTAFLNRWRDVLVTIVDRGTYLDVEDIGGLVDASMPGADEVFGLLVLAQLVRSDGRSPRERLVVDTAPTGHTLRLLALPETFSAMIALLESMQAKHRFMVNALTRRYRRDAADDFLDEMRDTLEGLRDALGNPARAGAVLVTRPEHVVVSETMRYANALRGQGITIAAIVVDAMDRTDAATSAAVGELATIGSVNGLFTIPRIEPPPAGLVGCSQALDRVELAGVPRGRNGSVRKVRKGVERGARTGVPSKAGGPPLPRLEDPDRTRRTLRDLLRTLTIVGGKGGVGKTTVSLALAIFSTLENSDRSGDTLLISTDPAPSIADALGIADASWAKAGPEPVVASPGLYVWQIDAASAFHELRDRYRERIDHFFAALTGGSIDVAHDRVILRDLLALAPPGIDELYALASLGDTLQEGRYRRVIVDPAPTGHLMRLVELPPLAVDWSHRLMRLIMKYREISGLVEAAQDLVKFSRRTRALNALLHDATRAGVVLVSLDEPAVVTETRRLSARLAATGIAINGLVRNRVSRSYGVAWPESTNALTAPETDPAPIGVAAIREWCERWRVQN